MIRSMFTAALVLTGFVSAAPTPVTATKARLWLEVPADSAPLKITSPDGTITQGNWLATQAEKERLSDITFPITSDEWKKGTIQFTSESDSSVTLSLLGPWNEKGAPEYVLYDKLSLTGATLANPSFEVKEGSFFKSWRSGTIPFDQWPIVDEHALDGENIAPAWNNTPLAQTFAVKAGVPVTLTLFTKSASPPGSEKLFPLGQKTPAHAAAREIQRGINFGNRWEVAPPFSWQMEYSLDDVDLAAAQGFDHLRIPISWQHYLTRKNGLYEISPKLLSEIDPFINRALEKKMHVIIDWHHFDDFTSAPDAFQQQFVDGWKAIARHYQDSPKELWFELLNEPKDEMSTERFNLAQDHAINAIRRISPERTILVTVGNWSHINELPKLRLPADDDNLIVTVHCYEPFNFTHQGASWVDRQELKNIRFPGPPETPFVLPDSLKNDSGIVNFIQDYNTLSTAQNPSSIAPIRALLDQAAAWSKASGRPVHLGEFGVSTFADPESRARYAQGFRILAEERNIPWALWDWKAGFAYWDENTKKPLLKEALFGK